MQVTAQVQVTATAQAQVTVTATAQAQVHPAQNSTSAAYRVYKLPSPGLIGEEVPGE